MAQTVASGAYGYVNYGFESTEGTVASSFPKSFGHGVKLSVSRKNNMERVYGVGARNASANVAKKYEGMASIEFMLDAQGSWWRAVMGALPTDAGAGPYTHTFAESNTLLSFSIANAVELGSNDMVSALIGAKVDTCTLSFAVDEITKVKLECPYRTETMASSGIGSAVAPSEEPLSFQHGTISVGGSTVAYVQSGEVTISNNVEMVWGVGSRYSTAGPVKQRAYDFKFSLMMSDLSLVMENFYGTTLDVSASDLATLNPAGVACVLTFDNGLSSTSSRKVVLTFANLYFNDHDTGLDVNELVKEDVTGYALSCTNVVVTNNTATDQATP